VRSESIPGAPSIPEHGHEHDAHVAARGSAPCPSWEETEYPSRMKYSLKDHLTARRRIKQGEIPRSEQEQVITEIQKRKTGQPAVLASRRRSRISA